MTVDAGTLASPANAKLDPNSLGNLIRCRICKWHQRYTKYRNKFTTVLWPGSLLNLGMTVGGVTAMRHCKFMWLQPAQDTLKSVESIFPFSQDIPDVIPTACVCSLTGLTIFVIMTLTRRGLLRLLLSRRSWMYEPPNKQSVITVLWGLSVRMMSGWSSSLYSHQSSLPRMPVPPLKESINELIASLEPVFANEPEKMDELKKEAEEFLNGLGPKVQRALVLRSWWEDNFVSDWWHKYVYLMGRSPLPINSNYYIMDHGYWTPTKRQCARAAGTLYQICRVRKMIMTENLDPLVIRNVIPICMDQYRKVFSTTRVPGEELDELVNYKFEQSQHVVVSRRGLLYKVNITASCGELLKPSELEKQMEWIVEDADNRYESVPENERRVAALTSQERTAWARARKQFFSSGVNKETLHIVESAVLFLVLDVHAFPDLSPRADYLLHGESGSFWFDKSIQLISMTDGHFGCNCEHSFADAPVIAHVLEFNLTLEVTTKLYDDDGHCIDPQPATYSHSHTRSKPTPLQWEVDEQLSACIARAWSGAEKNNNDLDLCLFDHTTFGKGDMKKCKVSPDAFIQMALHATYRKLTGVPALTYEASMTRLYKNGRTETVRSLTQQADGFVRAFLDASKTSEEKGQLLRKACERHATMYKDAMNGMGLDRHLFALYVASRGLSIDCEFLKKVLSIPWTLSTSQQPQQQIAWSPSCSDPRFANQLCPGGGFGPVADDGYGVSYMVPGDKRVFFHVSSRKSAPGTSSAKFMDTLKETLLEMRDLFQ